MKIRDMEQIENLKKEKSLRESEKLENITKERTLQ